MSCRACVTARMAECDLSGEMKKQRCCGCWKQHGGFQVHNAATKKLMLMQAATQMMLFCGPRQEGEPEETFDEQRTRRACLNTIVECGFTRALSIPCGPNSVTDFYMTDYDNLTSHGWTMALAPRRETKEKRICGYAASAIDGRLLLRLAEAGAQLDKLREALAHARRAVELLNTLDKGQGVPLEKQRNEDGTIHHLTLREIGHPARTLIKPAQELVQQLSTLLQEKLLEDKRQKGGGGDDDNEGDGGKTPRSARGVKSKGKPKGGGRKR